MTQSTGHPHDAANENTDPFLRLDTGLAELYRLRRELLAQDVSTMSLAHYRLRREALETFARVEASLLGKV